MRSKLELVIIAILLTLVVRTDTKADVPFTAIQTRIITVTMNTPATIASLVGSSDVFECFKLANPTTNLLCLGQSSAVGTSVAAGTQCWPICTGGAFCAEGVTSVPYSTTGTFINAPATFQVAVILGNGCGESAPSG